MEIVEDDDARLVLFGVIPAFSATGYGYIERGDLLSEALPRAYEVRAFREKPHQSLADQYIREGHFFWNCGIFCWRAQTIMDLLAQFEPEMHAGLLRIAEGLQHEQSAEAIATEFPKLKNISIDYAVLERARGVVVVEARSRLPGLLDVT